MNPELWSRVDHYLADVLIGDDAQLTFVLEACREADLPAIQVSAMQGKLLMLLARMIGARRILEIGTLGGYSAVWLCRGMAPGGRLITLEIDPTHAKVAQANFDRCGLAGVIELRVGPAAESLAKLVAERPEPFDLVFIDADKPSNPDYLAWALQLVRPGSVIIIDNVVRSGDVADADSADPRVHGVRRMNEMFRGHDRLSATTIQTVGEKGYDGFTLALVNR